MLFCFLLLSFITTVIEPARAAAGELDTLINHYVSKKDLTDWEALVLGVNGVKIKTPLFTTPYFKRVEKDVIDRKGEYRQATDYARIALVYKSHGKDPSDIAGYDLIEKLIHFPRMENQGLNAYTWALIALYGMDASVTAPLIDSILRYQMPSGAFSSVMVTKEKPDSAKADIDLTAMAVTALAPYGSDHKIRDAVDAAVTYLSTAQEPDGTYKANGVSNAESVSQVIIALCAAGVAFDDARFVKSGDTWMQALDIFLLADGTYAHIQDGASDAIATRQAALALSAYRQAAAYDALTQEERAAAKVRRGIFEILS